MYASKEVHYALGSILCLVGLFGILGNTLVLLVFSRFKRLQSPFSCLIINLAIGDLGTSCLHIMVVVSSFKGKWAFGSTGCVFYAFGVGFFGMMSIFTLAAISVERYLVITSRPLSSWKLTRRGARKICFVSWMYCTSLVTPPLFGWSRYTLEGLLTSCSWDYTTKTVANTVYYLYLLGFGFIVPVAVITYCYTSIVSAVFAHGREMAGVDMTTGRSGNSGAGKSTSLNNAHSTSLKTAEIIFILIAFFFLSWTPYAVITFIGHFGPEGILNPWITAMPAYFAKMSVIYNPIVYGLSHPHFQSSVKQYLSTWMASSSNNSKDNEEPTTGRNAAVALNPIKHDQHFRCFSSKTFEDVDLGGHLDDQDVRVIQEKIYQTIKKDSPIKRVQPITLTRTVREYYI